jgi:regulator of cell morphogenesis and NO signaling
VTSIASDVRVADLVVEQPTRARVFERFGIDYCCGGRVPLAEACAERGIELDAVLEALAEPLEPGPEDVDWSATSLAALVDHVVAVHHAYLRQELPSLAALVDKVATRHGDRHPELLEVRETFEALAAELYEHMHKEEQILFPACVALEDGRADGFPFGTVANPIAMLVHEHDVVARALTHIAQLTDGFTPPADACTSFRAMIERLHVLDRDVRRHVHEENNVLFPRAISLEGAA